VQGRRDAHITALEEFDLDKISLSARSALQAQIAPATSARTRHEGGKKLNSMD